jgi:protein gp37
LDKCYIWLVRRHRRQRHVALVVAAKAADTGGGGGVNKQQKANGSRGIEWTDYTWNAVGGCKHQCRWTMPDGTIAECYAETVANKFTRAYPHGFEHHYWRPHKLNEPGSVKQPAKVFIDSMSDLMGHWVTSEQIEAVLDTCRQVSQHTYQLLTKNAPRLLQFDFPPNVWVGVSSPPDFMHDHQLDQPQQARMLRRSLDVLDQVNAPVTWMSFEPLSWDVAPIVAEYSGALRWAVIGAASNGPRKYQPKADHVAALLDVLDEQGVPVFFKGNLKWSPHREDWPTKRN